MSLLLLFSGAGGGKSGIARIGGILIEDEDDIFEIIEVIKAVVRTGLI